MTKNRMLDGNAATYNKLALGILAVADEVSLTRESSTTATAAVQNPVLTVRKISRDAIRRVLQGQ